MHISCPRCNKVLNVRDENLFNVYECKSCSWRFRGVHANQPHLRNLVNSFIAPLYTNNQVSDLANCPHCSSLVDLNWIGLHTYSPRPFGPLSHIGYNGPYACKSCCRSLPWDYPPQHDFVVKDWNENVCKKRPEPSSKNHTTPSKDLAEIAETLYKKKHGLT